ncbi:hypothetical protein ACWDYH_00505 [Nocardia goodfellowii]
MKIYTDAFMKAVAEYLRKTEDLDIKEAYSFEERSYEVGGCDTCSYTETVVDITYKDSKGKSREFTLSASFDCLVRSLTD